MSRFLNHVPKDSIFLAPMEGVTDDIYRNVIFDNFGGWDFYACDFLRITSEGRMPKKLILHHIGEQTLQRPELLEKTFLQVLASTKSNIEQTVEDILDFPIDWLDVNLGCPSKRVNGHRGGAYLLEDLDGLKQVVQRLRKSFPKLFTAKIRLGYHDESKFFDILKLLNDEGVEAITIHGRTKDQMYKGKANWDYIAKAVEVSDVPIIGNGDIFLPSDIDGMLKHTSCHGVMVARGALQNPWLAKVYKSFAKDIHTDNDFLETYKIPRVKRYFKELSSAITVSDEHKLKRFKGLSKYTINDIENSEEVRSKLLRSKELSDFMGHIQSL